jgi:hypothetical protein
MALQKKRADRKQKQKPENYFSVDQKKRKQSNLSLISPKKILARNILDTFF